MVRSGDTWRMGGSNMSIAWTSGVLCCCQFNTAANLSGWILELKKFKINKDFGVIYLNKDNLLVNKLTLIGEYQEYQGVHGYQLFDKTDCSHVMRC